MSFWSRILVVVFLFVGAATLINKETLSFTDAVAANAYALVVGTSTPIPLERPPFLARTDLDDCLSGIGDTEGDDVYAAFCEDLANLTLTPANLSQPESPQTPARKNVRVKEAACASLGNAAEGIIPVQRHCRVESPVSGTVLYADHFKGYRGIVILETTKGARVTLAGLEEVHVTRGDKAARGDVLGITPEKTAPALADTAGSGDGPALLYVRDRANGARTVQPAS